MRVGHGPVLAMAKPKPTGRLRLRRPHVVGVSLSDEELGAVRAAMEAEAMTLSEVIRRAIRAQLLRSSAA